MAARMGRTKICILLPTHWALRMGGAQYQAKILVDYLITTGKFDIYYLSRRIREDFQPTGYKIIKIPGAKKVRPSRFFENTFSLLKILNDIKPDVIYQQVGCAYTGIAAYYAKRNKCKMVWRVSSDMNLIRAFPKLSSNMVNVAIDRAMLAYGIRNADKILVQTPHQGKLLEQNYHREADAVIRNFHPHPEEFVIKSQPIKVLWIANFKRLKQPEIFVRLARDMSDASNVQFIMVGAPATGQKWFSDLQREISSVSNLSYYGLLSQAEVNRLIAESHLLVNTSQYEGFSNTFIQAWMRKVPVLTLNVNPDGIFDDCTIGFCAQGNYSILLQKTMQLTSAPIMLQDMADHAQSYAYKHHSLKNIEQIVGILSEES